MQPFLDGHVCQCTERVERLEAALQQALGQLTVMSERLAAVETVQEASETGAQTRRAWEESVEGRMALIEGSVDRALANMMPKVEALLQGMERRSVSTLNIAAAVAGGQQGESSPDASLSTTLPRPTAPAVPEVINDQPVVEAVATTPDDLVTSAHSAAANGDLDTLLHLIEIHGERVVTARDGRGNTPLHVAASAGQVGALEVLLGAANDVANLSGWHLRTPLHAAALAGQTDAACSLLAAGAQPYAVDADSATPLHLASDLGLSGMVTLLIVEGAFPRPADAEGRVPLHRAAAAGHATVVEELLNQDSQNNTDGEDPEPDVMDHRATTPLMLAAANGQIEVVDILIRSGAALQATDANGQTALHYAVAAHDLVADAAVEGVVRALLREGANVDASDSRGRTPLWEAARYGRCAALRPLLEAGASANAYDAGGSSPLEMAATGGHTMAARVLLGAGAPSDDQQIGRALAEATNGSIVWTLVSAAPATIRGSTGARALWRAVRKNRAETLAALLDAGVSPQVTLEEYVGGNSSGSCGSTTQDEEDDACCGRRDHTVENGNFGSYTALHEAAELGYAACVSALLARGAQATALGPSPEGRTALHLAAAKGFYDCTAALLAVGSRALVSMQDAAGNTPLHLAAEGGHVDCVQSLLTAGADPRARNNVGRPPKGFDERHHEVAEILAAAVVPGQ